MTRLAPLALPLLLGLCAGPLAAQPTAEPAGEAGGAEWAPLPAGAFTLAVLPDTQRYARLHPEHFHKQTEWIAAQAEARNIRMVLHLGDITDNNNAPQWEVARAAFDRIEGKVPYALAPGNHDYGDNGSANKRTTLLNEYFPLEQAKEQPTFGGAMEEGKLENTYHTFRAGKHEYLVLALEWGPRDAVVAWANEVAARHPRHRKILITHAYLYFDDTRYDWAKHGPEQKWNPHSYGTGKEEGGTNDGEQLWEKLVSKHPGFILTLNGHVLGDGQALLTSPGFEGAPVHQMLVNYQMNNEGGEGFLRLLEFSPDGSVITARSYSPSLDTFKTDAANQFTLMLVKEGEESR